MIVSTIAQENYTEVLQIESLKNQVINRLIISTAIALRFLLFQNYTEMRTRDTQQSQHFWETHQVKLVKTQSQKRTAWSGFSQENFGFSFSKMSHPFTIVSSYQKLFLHKRLGQKGGKSTIFPFQSTTDRFKLIFRFLTQNKKWGEWR